MTCDPLNIDESLASIARSVNGIYSLMLLTFIISIFILGVMVLWQIA